MRERPACRSGWWRPTRSPTGSDAAPGAAGRPGGEIRDGAWVAELAGDVLAGWPKGMRLIVRKERPHPVAQLRFIDADGSPRGFPLDRGHRLSCGGGQRS